MIALTEQPWDLPASLLRADAIEAVWHLDLPDAKERAEIWDLAAKRHGQDQPGCDHVILARASHEFTPAEIHAAYARAVREGLPHPPKERHLFQARSFARHRCFDNRQVLQQKGRKARAGLPFINHPAVLFAAHLVCELCRAMPSFSGNLKVNVAAESGVDYSVTRTFSAG